MTKTPSSGKSLISTYSSFFAGGRGWELEGGLWVGAYFILSTRWMEWGGGGRLFEVN